MPFNKENAAEFGRKGGKKTKPPELARNKQIRLAVTESELNMIDEKAEKAKLSRVDLVIKAVKKLRVW